MDRPSRFDTLLVLPGGRDEENTTDYSSYLCLVQRYDNVYDITTALSQLHHEREMDRLCDWLDRTYPGGKDNATPTEP